MINADIILIGKPGSGKGTLSKQLLDGDTKVVHLSTGEIFRQHMSDNTSLGIEIKDVMDSGQLVNDELTIAIVEDFCMKNLDKHIIFDGFPRNEHQLAWLLQFCDEFGRPQPFFTHLYVDNDIALSRILERAKNSGRVEDQNVSIVKKRLKIYKQEMNDINVIAMQYFDDDHFLTLDASLKPHKVYVQFMKKLPKN